MICPNCGKENDEKTNFCGKCGEKFSAKEVKTKTKVASNPAGVRKAMKQDAKKHVSGSFIGASAIFLVVCGVISAFTTGSQVYFNNNMQQLSTQVTLTETFSSLFVTLLGLIFGFGLFITGFRKIRDNKENFGDIFTSPFKKGKFLGHILLLFVLIFAISFVAGFIMIIPLLGFLALIGLIIAYVYFTPTIEAFMLILADDKTNKNITFAETWKKAMDLSKGNRVEYWGITCSFIGWVLLAFLTCGILFIWLLPYMQFTYINMYRRWTGEELFDSSESGLSNGAVIGFTVGGFGCFTIILSIIIATIALGLGFMAENNPDMQDRIRQFTEDTGMDEFDFNTLIDEIKRAGEENA